MKTNFLIQLSQGFWTRTADGTPYSVPEPWRATHLGYEQADRVCQELREQGYRVTVTNLWGQPVGLTELAEARMYIIRSALLPGDYFVRFERDRMVVTHEINDAFRAGYSVIRAVAEDLKTAGQQVEVVDVTDVDPRQTDAYREVMGILRGIGPQ